MCLTCESVGQCARVLSYTPLIAWRDDRIGLAVQVSQLTIPRSPSAAHTAKRENDCVQPRRDRFPHTIAIADNQFLKLVQYDFFHIFQMPAHGRFGRLAVMALDSRQDTPMS